MSKNKKILILGLISLLVCAIDLFIGVGELVPRDLVSLNELQRTILFKIRMPEMATALIIGMILGLAGACMQTILDNPLASPFTLGVSSAAGFGASLFLLLGISINLIAFGAIGFALIAIIFVYIISRRSFAHTSSMILAGIAVKFFFDSLTSLMQYISTDETLSSIVFWLFGSVSNTNPKQIAILFASFILAFILIIKDSHKLTSLRFGEERAKSLGVDVKRVKIKTFMIVSILSSIGVSFAGVIGFIGVIAPHLARKILGEDQRYYLIGSSLIGAILLVFSSGLSKIVKPGAILPIGIIASLVGLPLIFIFFFGGKND
ncbi:Probable ABC transporter permease protein HI_1471 [Anaerococcus prevotii]|uniref:Transport system permease protein n=1 Tax=Anaerococcus prevotii (strain ATCC 9321 / DSM 20548 / JCM 6508 / NCTC 11806 / PC1) TaxID=525919 RepID=C7REW6_ANAPD|nr:iron ABC transporter permease [Anaerococcus prevotii]ACV29729.1 transport system permease protein [Anaerococcus prevotii DSM 20548]SUU95402.1 Probable ABC transporter permease protein HI_1471 [Anaerococcus prevotii]